VWHLPACARSKAHPGSSWRWCKKRQTPANESPPSSDAVLHAGRRVFLKVFARARTSIWMPHWFITNVTLESSKRRMTLSQVDPSLPAAVPYAMTKKSFKNPSLRSKVSRPRRKKPPELRPCTPDDNLDRSVELVSVALEVWEHRINHLSNIGTEKSK